MSGPYSPLFCLRDGSPLSRSQFVDWLRDALERAYLPSKLFAPHSLQRGFATSCSTANVPDHLIKTLGRWSSDCYQSYIDTPNAAIARTHETLGTV